MDYQETLDWMFSKLPMYQRQGSSAFKKDLTNIIALSEQLGNPHKTYPTIHVAGTNGKGSTSHMISSVLQTAGYRVGLYTSPHLKDFRERIKVDGQDIDRASVIDFVEQHHEFLDKQKLSFFELTVGMAFAYFQQRDVDIAVIEVGLGGRLDSTNIINPLVAVITNIGLDHTQFLGETLPEIAFEKAGIIKPDTPVVIGEYQEAVFDVFESIAKQKHAPLYIAEQLVGESYQTDLQGSYQKKNLKTAVQALNIVRQKGFEIDHAHYATGLLHVIKNTGLKGRWQVLGQQPKIIADTAHNAEGLSMVMAQLQQENFEHLHMVIGVVNDKELNGILTLMPKKASYYFCRPNIPRGLSAELLAAAAKSYGLYGNSFETVASAYKEARKRADKADLIYVGGSTFVVAELDL